MTRRDTALSVFERLSLVIGVTLLILFVAALIHRDVYSRLALRGFNMSEAGAADTELQTLHEPVVSRQIDFSLWSQKRFQEYRNCLLTASGSPLAALHLDKLSIHAPVFEGTDDLNLNRGVGWIVGTTRPGERGNVGIAGHRDGFFRGLKDVATGDAIRLSTERVSALYIVDQIELVKPENVEVLKPRSLPSITLVTCYPFYFIGDAPQRFIVHAALKQQVDTGQFHQGSASARANQIESKEKEK
jgi:sortase A